MVTPRDRFPHRVPLRTLKELALERLDAKYDALPPTEFKEQRAKLIEGYDQDAASALALLAIAEAVTQRLQGIEDALIVRLGAIEDVLKARP